MLFYLISCQCEPSSLGAHLVIPKNVVHFTCIILLPSMFISASLILYFFPFGVKIMKFVFLELVGIKPSREFMQLNIYFLNKSVEASV